MELGKIINDQIVIVIFWTFDPAKSHFAVMDLFEKIFV
jgi:hypothetical protein